MEMSLGQNITYFKNLTNQGIDLMLLRLQILSLDLTAQVGSLIKVVAVILLSTALFLLGMISLLFGLNSVLTPEAKIWVFFGISGLSLLIIIGLFSWVNTAWQHRGNQVAETLRDIQQDIAYLRGQTVEKNVANKERV